MPKQLLENHAVINKATDNMGKRESKERYTIEASYVVYLENEKIRKRFNDFLEETGMSYSKFANEFCLFLDQKGIINEKREARFENY